MSRRASSVVVAALALLILPRGFAQAPSVTAVLNEASRGARLCPGVRAIVLGRFGGGGEGWSVWVGDRTAPTTSFGTGLTGDYFKVHIPIELSPGPTTLIVERGNLKSDPFNVVLSDFAPGLFSLNGLGTGQGYFGRQPFRSPLVDSVWLLGTSFFDLNARLRDLVIEDPMNRAVPGEILVAYCVGLGPTVPVIPTGDRTAPPAATANPLRLSVGGRQAEILWGGLPGGYYVGLYDVRFRVPGDLPEGTHAVTLEIAGTTSNAVTMPVGKRAPVITSLVNAASFTYEGDTAPGSIVTLFCEHLEARDQLSGFPATTFQGVTVTFNDIPAPLFHLIGSRRQINLVVPSELPVNKTVAVQVKTPLGTSPRYYLNMPDATPGMFFISDPTNPSRRNAAALFANTAWRVMPRSLAAALRIPADCKGVARDAICGQPALPGDVIQIYATGLGRATPGGDPAGPPLATGSIAPPDGRPLYLTVRKPEIKIGNVAAEVQFSGLAPGFAGLYQINVRIPEGAPTGDDVPVTISAFPFSDSATLAIQR